MILFFYGEDNYSSYLKLAKSKEKFISKNGDFNLSFLEGENLDSLQVLKKHLETVPLFGGKSMVIIKNFLSQNKDKELQKEISNYIKKYSGENIAIFYESQDSFDRRSSLFKQLASQQFAEEFKIPTGYALDKWITAKVQSYNLTITPEAMNELTFQSMNPWHIIHEIEKFDLYKPEDNRTITEDDIKLHVYGTIQSNIFKMIDHIAQKKTKDALIELETLINNGENEIKILSMITYQFRVLVQARDMLNQGKTKNDLIQRAKLKPFVATKSMNQAKNFTLDELKGIYSALVETDLLIKTSTSDPRLALNRLLVRICIQ